MSEIVRCIGGELDTEQQEIDNQRVCDIIRIRKVDMASYNAYNDASCFKTYDYKLATIECEGKTFKFLIPFDWTNYQAIKYQFSK